MKSKIHWFSVISIMFLFFCIAYLVTRLICEGLYVNAAFAIAIPILVGLMVYFIRTGK